MNRAYRYALVAGATPLLTGTAIFLLWLVTRWEGLMHAGVFTVIAGLVAFACGSMALVIYGWLAYRDPMVSRRRFWLSTLGCAALLLFNFPAAMGITIAAIIVDTRYSVVVRNETAEPLHEVRIFGGGCDKLLGTIPASGVAKCSLWIDGDGTLMIHAVQGTSNIESTVDDYVTGNMGGHATVTIGPDGFVTVEQSDHY